MRSIGTPRVHCFGSDVGVLFGGALGARACDAVHEQPLADEFGFVACGRD